MGVPRRYVTDVGRPESECSPYLVVREVGCFLVVGTRTIALIPATTVAELRAQADVVTLGPVAT